MKNLKIDLENKGVKFILEIKVTGFQKNGSRIINVSTDKEILASDEVVIATGAWSETLLKPLGINLSVQAGKGYSIDVAYDTGISLPAILLESKVAVTPMLGFTRFAGTMEISGINHEILTKRVNAIGKAAQNYYPEVLVSQETLNTVQCGLRPLSPDGIPFIGRHSAVSNLVLATGHSMMGWSLGPATGKLVSELISEKSTSLSLKPFAPERPYGKNI